MVYYLFLLFLFLFSKNSKRVSGSGVCCNNCIFFFVYFGGFLFFSTFSIEINWKIVQNVNKQTGTHKHTHTQMYIDIHTFMHPPQTTHTHSCNDEGSPKATASHHHHHCCCSPHSDCSADSAACYLTRTYVSKYLTNKLKMKLNIFFQFFFCFCIS